MIAPWLSIATFLAAVIGGPILFVWIARRVVFEKRAGLALSGLVLVAGAVLFALLSAYGVNTFLVASFGGQLLLAWLAHRHVPATYGRIALAALVLIAAAAVAAFYVGFTPIVEAASRETAAKLLQLPMVTALGALYLTVAFVPSLFSRHHAIWTALIAPFVYLAFLGLWFAMGIIVGS